MIDEPIKRKGRSLQSELTADNKNTLKIIGGGPRECRRLISEVGKLPVVIMINRVLDNLFCVCASVIDWRRSAFK